MIWFSVCKKGKKMNVSIIIPVHNSEKYLEECVNSVLSGINEDDEIILVENGSSDSSWDMCQNYSSQYTNIKAVSLDTAGVSIARNKGIADIVLFQYRFLGEGDGVSLGEDDPLEVRNVDPDLLKHAVLQYAKYQNAVREEAGLDNVTIWSACAKLIRRNLVRENKIHFPEKLCLSEDTAFSLQLYCCAEKVERVEQNAFFYRRTESSASRIIHPKTLVNNQYLRRWIVYYTRKKGCYEELSREISGFLCRKFVEECLYLRGADMPCEEKLQYIKENASAPFMKRALREAGYRYLIAGKRNTLRYVPFLWLLKRKLYRMILVKQS